LRHVCVYTMVKSMAKTTNVSVFNIFENFFECTPDRGRSAVNVVVSAHRSRCQQSGRSSAVCDRPVLTNNGTLAQRRHHHCRRRRRRSMVPTQSCPRLTQRPSRPDIQRATCHTLPSLLSIVHASHTSKTSALFRFYSYELKAYVPRKVLHRDDMKC